MMARSMEKGSKPILMGPFTERETQSTTAISSEMSKKAMVRKQTLMATISVNSKTMLSTVRVCGLVMETGMKESGHVASRKARVS